MEALKNLSFLHPSLIFVTCIIPDFVATTERMDACVRAADQTVRYNDAPSYQFLSRLYDDVNAQIMIYEHGAGPLRVVQHDSKSECTCGKPYSKRSVTWRRPGVRRHRCRKNLCPDVLVVSKEARLNGSRPVGDPVNDSAMNGRS